MEKLTLNPMSVTRLKMYRILSMLVKIKNEMHHSYCI